MLTELERQINNIKAVRRRIAQAAARVNPKTESEFSAALNEVEESSNVEEQNAEWSDRQIERYRDNWFLGSPTIRNIQRTTCDVYGVELNDLLSDLRTLDIVLPRHVSMYLAREMTGLSYPQIARSTGLKNHSTAIHAYRKIEKLLQSDAQLAANIAEIKARLS